MVVLISVGGNAACGGFLAAPIGATDETWLSLATDVGNLALTLQASPNAAGLALSLVKQRNNGCQLHSTLIRHFGSLRRRPHVSPRPEGNRRRVVIALRRAPRNTPRRPELMLSAKFTLEPMSLPEPNFTVPMHRHHCSREQMRNDASMR